MALVLILFVWTIISDYTGLLLLEKKWSDWTLNRSGQNNCRHLNPIKMYGTHRGGPEILYPMSIIISGRENTTEYMLIGMSILTSTIVGSSGFEYRGTVGSKRYT